MKAPLSWIKDFVDIDISPRELADKLLSAGFEVEDIEYLGKDIDNVVVGAITKITKHPNADKLRVCDIDIGGKSVVIVTGAQNVQEGDLVPAALDGARLFGGKEIRTSDLRGVTSYGTLCSGQELGVDNTVIEGAEDNGIIILNSLDVKAGDNILDALGLDDYVLDISITANRPDCQSILGIAREIAVATNQKLRLPDLKFRESEKEIGDLIKVEVEDNTLCTRYMGRYLTDVVIKESPRYIAQRLRKVGIRSINNMVDITNYVLTEIGQPMHAFDARFVDGGKVVVRRAKVGESITALDGKVYKLDPNMLVIADCAKPIGVAGVMGGEYSGILEDTSAVVLESARFNRGSVRKTSRLLGLRSASSARFEKGVDPWTVDMGMRRALNLVTKLKAGRVVKGAIDVNCCNMTPKTITTTANEINGLLGIDISAKQIADILSSLDIASKASGNKITSTVPLYREDIDNFADLAEEVIRVYGYDHIEGTLLERARTTSGGKTHEQLRIDGLKNLMCALGASEITTYSFLPERFCKVLGLDTAPIVIRNPLSEEFAAMRTTLVYNMLGCIELNHSRKNKGFGLFEVGRAYIAKSLPLIELPSEPTRLCYGTDLGDFFDLKNVVQNIATFFGTTFEYVGSSAPYLHPGISADIVWSGEVIGSFGELHPAQNDNFNLLSKVYILELDLDALCKIDKTYKYAPLPKYPEVERDIAFTLPISVAQGDVYAAIINASPLISEVSLFDIYQGGQIEAGCKSMAYSIRLKGERTLVDAEINECMSQVLSALSDKFGAKLR